MPIEILRFADAAERLGITTREMVDLVRQRKVRYVPVDGIARIPSDVLEEYRTQRAC